MSEGGCRDMYLNKEDRDSCILELRIDLKSLALSKARPCWIGFRLMHAQSEAGK